MRTGEKWIIGITVMAVAVAILYKNRQLDQLSHTKEDIPYYGAAFYSTATGEVASKGPELYKAQGCKRCHSLWTTRNMLERVPAPALDGMGSIRKEEWLFKYFSIAIPQDMLPTRLKPEYRMPSYAHLSDQERRLLAQYIASFKVKDAYLEQVKKAEQEVLTGKYSSR